MSDQKFEANILFDAVQVLIDANNNKVAFDRSITGTITDNSEAHLGKYKVTSRDGLNWFYAYSENTKYKVGDQVRITIPNDDWSNPKYIDGKIQNDTNGEPVAYVPPLDTLVPGGPAILISNSAALIANGKEIEKSVGTLAADSLSAYQIPNLYDTIGVQASFKTVISPYKLAFGSYGLKIKVTYSYQDQARNDQVITYGMTSNEMFGNPYQYLIPTSQQVLIPILTDSIVSNIEIKLYQDGEFRQAGVGQSLLDPKKISDIICSDVQVYIGNNVINYEDNTVKLYSTNDLTYTNEKETQKKCLGVVWFNKDENDKYVGFSDGIKRVIPNSEYSNGWQNYYPELYGETANNTYAEENYLKWFLLKEIEMNIYDNGIKDDDNEIHEVKQNNLVCALAAIRFVKDSIKNELDAALKIIREQVEEGYNANGGASNTKNIFNDLNELLKDNFIFNDLFNNMEDSFCNFIIDDKNEDYVKASTCYNNINYKTSKIIEYGEKLSIDKSSYLKSYISLIKENIALIKHYYNKKIDTDALLLPYFGINNEIDWTDNSNYPYDNMKKIISKYDNHYSMYLLRRAKNYAGDKYFVETTGWQMVQSLGDQIPAFNEETIQKVPDSEKNEVTANLQINNNTPKLIDIILQPKDYEDKYKVVLFYNHERFESSILTFEHADKTNEQTKADFETNAKIKHKDNSQSNYQEYNSDGYLLESAQSEIERWVCIEYTDPDTGSINDTRLSNCDIIWRLSKKSNLRHISGEGQYNKLTAKDLITYAITQNEDYDYYVYNTSYTGSTESKGKTYFHYSIPQAYVKDRNDTITCLIRELGGVWIELSITIGFMRTGDSGTPYNIFLTPKNKKGITTSGTQFNLVCTNQNGQEMKIVLNNEEPTEEQVVLEYDTLETIYSGTDLENQKTILFNPRPSSTKEGYEWAYDKTAQIITITRINASNNNRYACLKVRIKVLNNDNIIEIDKYFPVYLSSASKYYLCSPDIIKYDSTGANPQYDKDKLCVKEYNTDNLYTPSNGTLSYRLRYIYWTGTNWSADTDIEKAKKRGQPQLNQQIIQVPTLYVNNEYPAYTVLEAYITTKNNEESILWCQSIFIYQDAFNSNFLNNWNGEYWLDKDNNTLMAAMLGAGYKDTKNRFSGVLIGQVSAKAEITPPNFTIDDTKGIGLYGIHEGKFSYGFNIEGTAFLGKSSGGRIWFDGNHGFIASQNWINTGGIINSDGSIKNEGITNEKGEVTTEPDGMAIDLQNGHIDAYNFKLTSAGIKLNSIPPKGGDYIVIGEDLENGPYIKFNKDGDLRVIANSFHFTSGNFINANILKYSEPRGITIDDNNQITASNFNYTNGIWKNYWHLQTSKAVNNTTNIKEAFALMYDDGDKDTANNSLLTNSTFGMYQALEPNSNIKWDTTYTYSVQMRIRKTSNDTLNTKIKNSKLAVRFQYMGSDNKVHGLYANNTDRQAVDINIGTFQQITKTFTMPKKPDNYAGKLRIYFYFLAGEAFTSTELESLCLDILHPKLEEGTRQTEWCAHSDDVYNILANYDSILDQNMTFDKLTNYGTTKGIWMNGNDLFINATVLSTSLLRSNTFTGTITPDGTIKALDEEGRYIVLNTTDKTTIYYVGKNSGGTWTLYKKNKEGTLSEVKNITFGKGTDPVLTSGYSHLLIPTYDVSNVTAGTCWDLNTGKLWAANFELTAGKQISLDTGVIPNTFLHLSNKGIKLPKNHYKVFNEDGNTQWPLIIGTQFRVTSTGQLVATDAYFSGEISASSGDIGGIIINDNSLVASQGEVVIINDNNADNYSDKFLGTMIYNNGITTVSDHNVSGKWSNFVIDLSASGAKLEKGTTYYVSNYESGTEWYYTDTKITGNVVLQTGTEHGYFRASQSHKIKNYKYLIINTPNPTRGVTFSTGKESFSIDKSGKLNCTGATIQGDINIQDLSANTIGTTSLTIDTNDGSAQYTECSITFDSRDFSIGPAYRENGSLKLCGNILTLDCAALNIQFGEQTYKIGLTQTSSGNYVLSATKI